MIGRACHGGEDIPQREREAGMSGHEPLKEGALDKLLLARVS
jgi:hypothetical protein